MPDIALFTSAILIMTSLYGLSVYYQEPRIFKFALIGGVAIIMSTVLISIIGQFVLLPNFATLIHSMAPGWDGNWASLPNITSDTNLVTIDGFVPSVLLIISLLITFLITCYPYWGISFHSPILKYTPRKIKYHFI
ncbi:MAG: hypothetical protein LBQ98_09385 [Nitrososphaerota archaeon]|nr:hypothetical protein [Nitrososphaerota archaeon]